MVFDHTRVVIFVGGLGGWELGRVGVGIGGSYALLKSFVVCFAKAPYKELLVARSY